MSARDPAFRQEEDERLPFPLRRSYREIVKDMRNGTVVPVLGPSVNTRIYIDLAALYVRLLVQADFPNEPQVAEEREKKYVKAYYGSLCTTCHFLPTSVPPGCPLLGVPIDVNGCDLRLMSSLNNVSGIPTEGKNLIIVAAVNNVLHFRIFDGDGKVIVDTDEKRMTEQAGKSKISGSSSRPGGLPTSLPIARRAGLSPLSHQSSVYPWTARFTMSKCFRLPRPTVET